MPAPVRSVPEPAAGGVVGEPVVFAHEGAAAAGHSGWMRARVRARLHRIVLDELGARGELDWSRCAIDSVSLRAIKGGH
ncbi:hypothetical protein GCM10027073_67060 [Streptomyces chlorus]